MNSSTVRVTLLAVSLCFVAHAEENQAGGALPPLPGKALPSQYLPKELKLSIGGSGISTPSYSVELKGESLRYHVREFDPAEFAMREVDTTITPSGSQWLQFWKAMDAIGVWRWKPTYSNADAAEGANWGVELALGDRKVTSFGRNAYPEGESGPADSDESDADPSEGGSPFKTYLRAVENLLGGARFR